MRAKVINYIKLHMEGLRLDKGGQKLHEHYPAYLERKGCDEEIASPTCLQREDLCKTSQTVQ